MAICLESKMKQARFKISGSRPLRNFMMIPSSLMKFLSECVLVNGYWSHWVETHIQYPNPNTKNKAFPCTMNPTYLMGISSFIPLSSAEKSCWKRFSNTASIHLIHLKLNSPYPWTLKGSQKLKDELASRRDRNSCRWSTTPFICTLV